MSNTQPKQEPVKSPAELARGDASTCARWFVGGAALASLSFAFLILFAAMIAGGNSSLMFFMGLFATTFTAGATIMASNYMSYKQAMFDLGVLTRKDQEQK